MIAGKRLGETRLKILALIVRDGPMTYRRLGDAIGITHEAVKQHVLALCRDGLVFREPFAGNTVVARCRFIPARDIR